MPFIKRQNIRPDIREKADRALREKHRRDLADPTLSTERKAAIRRLLARLRKSG